MRLLLLLIIACLAAALHGCAWLPDDTPAQITLNYVSSFSANPAREGLPAGWEPWNLSRYKKPTECRLVREDGARVVRARASSSASGLVHNLDLDPAHYRLLQWRWKVDQLIPDADNTRKSAEDLPVQIVICCNGDIDKIEFDDSLFTIRSRPSPASSCRTRP